ncbi:MAG: trypsin-like serine peptidase [Paracoccaceae bacterium]
MTGAALNQRQAISLAHGIRGSRLAVAAVYDEIAARIGQDLPDFKTVALGQDDPVQAFAKVLMSAATTVPPWHGAFLAELAALGLMDPAALSRNAAASNPVTLLPQNDDGTQLDPQAFNAAMIGVLEVADLLSAFSLAARRLCLIRAGGKQGTGFLIGPQTVLTNWHVMSELIDRGTGKAVDGSAAKISVSFETLTDNKGRSCPVAEEWLVGFSPLVKAAADPLPQAVSPDGTFLDYCAIRLLGAPGRERGWYDLSQTGTLNHKTDAFFVFQHPAGVAQRAGVARDTVLDANTDFLRHQVWTASGSSGGLCLDHKLRPIALHHAAVWHPTELDDKGKPKLDYNRAILLSAIHAARPDLGKPELQYDRILRLSDGSGGVIGRKTTQEFLRRMSAGKEPPILIVKGDRKSGKSFTTVLLRELFPFDSFKIIQLSASDLKAEAVDLARLILEQAGKDPVEIEAGFKSLASLTTGPATVADVYATMKAMLLGIASASPVQPYTLWLVIDQLDVVALPRIGARSLLDKIYSDQSLLKVMRVILIGLPEVLTGVDPKSTFTEKLDDPNTLKPEDIEECLSGLMVAAGLVPSVGETKRHSAMMIGATGALDPQGRQSTQLAVLSGLVSGVYMKAVDAWK